MSLSQRKIDKLVLDYLVHEGYKPAAEHLIQEANLPEPPYLSDVERRMEIRAAVHQGDIEKAISLVNDMGTQLLQENKHLYFLLRRQQLIELIRNQDLETAVQFCKAELAPLVNENPEFCSELEEVLGLFVLADPLNSTLSYLLDQKHRQETATLLNAEILKQLRQEEDVQISKVLKLLLWLEKSVSEKDTPTTPLNWMSTDTT
eukprot:gene4110-45_t